MQVIFIYFFISSFVQSRSHVILESCPPGCECFERNTAIECKEAHLAEIPVMKFSNDVKRLVLRGNVIERVQEDELKRYPNLEYLDLSDNEISTLPGKIFSHNQHLKEINLGLNPFHCDCDLKDFSEVLHSYINSGSVVLKDTEITHCAAPPALVGKPVLNIAFQNERDKKRAKEIMYIGETEDRGIAICPELPAMPEFAKLQAKPVTTTSTTSASKPTRNSKKDSSPNMTLIIASVTAGVLVTCIVLASAIKYFLKKIRPQGFPWTRGVQQPLRNNEETFSDQIKRQRRVSRGYPASDCSSEEALATGRSEMAEKIYFKAKLQNQRRQSQGYSRMHATSGSASDLEDIELE